MDIHQEGLNVTLNSLASDHDNTHCTIKTDVSSSEEVKNSVKMAEVKCHCLIQRLVHIG